MGLRPYRAIRLTLQIDVHIDPRIAPTDPRRPKMDIGPHRPVRLGTHPLVSVVRLVTSTGSPHSRAASRADTSSGFEIGHRQLSRRSRSGPGRSFECRQERQHQAQRKKLASIRTARRPSPRPKPRNLRPPAHHRHAPI
jgi:hypothetical protein